MTKRYYYDCPLKASYMAKYHQLKFTDCKGILVSADPSMWCMSERHYKTSHPLYVHPDSVNILQPKNGDVVELLGNDQYYSNISGDYAEYFDSHVDEEHPIAMSLNAIAVLRDGKEQVRRVIQRNNTVFIWPEVEDDGA